MHGRVSRRRDETRLEDKASLASQRGQVACLVWRLHPASLAWGLCDIGREKKKTKHGPRLLPKCRAG